MPMINGKFYMNPAHGAGMERERAKGEERGRGGAKKLTKVEIHVGDHGDFAVHAHRSAPGQGPGSPSISPDEKAEVNQFPDHAKMIEFVHRLTAEANGEPTQPGNSAGERGEQAEGFRGKQGSDEHAPGVDGAGV